MPVALERKLKRQAAADPSIKDKDAYVYGVLRKTGWKPSREKKKEKKMNDSSKLVRLAQIDDQLDSIVRFAYNEEDQRQSIFGSPTQAVARAGVLTGAGAAGVGGYLGHKAIQQAGGYGAQWGAAQKAFGRGLKGTQLTGVKAGPGRFLGQYAGKGVGALRGLLSKIPGLKLSSQERMIQLDEKILEPFGAEEKSKIAQEQFPAGLSPAAALKLPFPELMKLLKQRNILQQQFSKLGKLVELDSRLDGIIKQ